MTRYDIFSNNTKFSSPVVVFGSLNFHPGRRVQFFLERKNYRTFKKWTSRPPSIILFISHGTWHQQFKHYPTPSCVKKKNIFEHALEIAGKLPWEIHEKRFVHSFSFESRPTSYWEKCPCKKTEVNFTGVWALVMIAFILSFGLIVFSVSTKENNYCYFRIFTPIFLQLSDETRALGSRMRPLNIYEWKNCSIFPLECFVWRELVRMQKPIARCFACFLSFFCWLLFLSTHLGTGFRIVIANVDW